MSKPSNHGTVGTRFSGAGKVISTLTVVILTFLATYQYVLPIDSELQLTRSVPLNAYQNSDSNNVTIFDFFKPYDPAYPTSLPIKNYYRRINLRPLSPYSVARVNFTEWIDQQCELSFQHLLQNVADSNLIGNRLVPDGVVEGAIIASPSKSSPDYYYQWIRDSAITIHTVVSNLFQPTAPTTPTVPVVSLEDQAKFNVTLAGTILKYMNNSYTLQRLSNPSGEGVNNESNNLLKGLGEPKWLVNNKPFTQNWGRPQNDGPPLRSLAIFHLLEELRRHDVTLKDMIATFESHSRTPVNLPFNNEIELFEKILYWDLKFVLINWKVNSFDLWEEVNGQHFFTSLVQFTAIKLGLNFLREYDDINWGSFDKAELVENLEECQREMVQFLTIESGFINPNKNYIVETPSILHSRSGLDIAVIIGSLLTHDDHFQTCNIPFDVHDSGILNTLYSMVKSMGIIYPINHQRAKLNIGVALGRYPEDVYDGIATSEGNPWFLATSSASELLYRLIWKNYQLKQDLVIPLNKWKSEFWTLIFDGFEDYPNGDDDIEQNPGNGYQLVIPFGSPAFKQTMISIFDLGESFLDKIREHVSDDGNMSEQFNKYTGYLQGAENLTWSYGAFWESCHVRSQVLPLVAAA